MIANYYDVIAQNYELISQKREVYLIAVESYISDKVERFRPQNILDVGSGDGSRLARIISKNSFKTVTSVEPSVEMFAKILSLKLPIISQNSTIENFVTEERFDLILCLWNVIGHVENIEIFLLTLRNLLTPEGAVIIDFNNKFNINQYGFKNVILNALASFNIGSNDRKKGNFKLDDSNSVKLWSRCEFNRISKRYFNFHEYTYLNYNTGKIEKNHLKGQIVVCLKNT